ncbi:MAG: translation initiation factor IF-1 [Blastochloris sp.]|nr:translation initiation factor IF-1 [Blastochloris sp.]
MQESSRLQVKATVIAAISTTRYRVELEDGKQMIVTLAGKLRMDFIRLLPATKVLVEFSPYDLSSGRIIEHESNKKI